MKLLILILSWMIRGVDSIQYFSNWFYWTYIYDDLSFLKNKQWEEVFVRIWICVLQKKHNSLFSSGEDFIVTGNQHHLALSVHLKLLRKFPGT